MTTTNIIMRSIKTVLPAALLGFACTGAGAQTLFLEDFEAGSSGDSITNAPYTWEAWDPGFYDVEVRDAFTQFVDEDGLALCGACGTWGEIHQYLRNIGQAIPADSVTVLSFKAYANTGSVDTNSSSHWSSVGLRSSNGGMAFVDGVTLNVTDLDDGTHHWNLDWRHVGTGGSTETWSFPQGRFFEEIVTGRILFDTEKNVTWASLTDSAGTVTSPEFPILRNANLDEVRLYWIVAGNGGYQPDAADIDDIRVKVISPAAFTNVVVADVGGIEFQGDRGLTYRLESSTDGTNYVETGHVLQGTDSVVKHFDPAVPSPSKSYRVVIDL